MVELDFVVWLLTVFGLIFIILLICARLTVGWCKSTVCLNGKTALIIGGSYGIGYETALGLASRGCRVIIAQRSNYKDLKEKIIKATGNNKIVIKKIDLTSLSSVRELAKNINETEDRLDILINNAALAGTKNSYTEDGLHMAMQANHFGSFLLTHLLIGLLKRSAPSRIIFVSSLLAYINNLTLENLNFPENASSTLWQELVVYGNAKLCNIITANELGKKLHGTGVTANALHPGLVHTEIFQKLCHGHNTKEFYSNLFYNYVLKYFAKDAQEGSQTTLHLALDGNLERVTGQFFSDCRSFPQPRKAINKEFCRKIWESSEKYVKLSPEERLL